MNAGDPPHSGPTDRMPDPAGPERFIVPALLIAFVAIYLVDLGHPFTRVGESHAAAIAKYARNYLRFGYAEHKFMIINASGPRLEDYPNPKDHYYADHPPLTALWISGFFALMGDSERIYRLAVLPILLAAFLGFHQVSLGILRARPAWIATGLFMFNPMTLHYGSATAYVVTPLAFSLWAIVLYERWYRMPSPKAASAVLVLQILGCYSGWEAYYLAPTILVIHLVKRRRPLTLPLVLIGVNLAVFALYLAHTYWLDPVEANAFHWLVARAGHWSSADSFSLWEYAKQEGRFMALLFTLPLAMSGFAIAAIAFWRATRPAAVPILPSLLLASHFIVFPRICIQHEYYILHLGVYLALAGGRVAEFLARPGSIPWRRVSMACAGLLVAAFVVQSVAVTYKRRTEIGVNAYHEELARAIHRNTLPADRLLVGIGFQTNRGGFTASRCITLYDAETRSFATEDGSPILPAPDPSALVRQLRQGSRHQVLVMSSREKVATEVPYFQALARHPESFIDICRYWRLPAEDDPFLAELRRSFPLRSADGFYFFDLTAPLDAVPGQRHR